jgi:CRP-like cAMP-binding protein
VLPLFRRFRPSEIDEFAQLATVQELDRGEIIFEQGSPSTSCHLLVRVAIEISHARNGRRHRIGILGSGRLCGVRALLCQPPPSSAS